ncbi:MAG: response regulator [Maribacter sp.]|nr:response regulator [Maribacter sp.]
MNKEKNTNQTITILKAKKLLTQLSSIETILNDFSFEELSSGEAVRLKKSFQSFKISLEEKVFRPSGQSKETISIDLEEEPKNRQIPLEANMLVAKVSHEIRTPLNGIIGFTDLLKEEGPLTERQTVQVNAIQMASYSLLDIINELLEYSKLSAGLEQFESVDFNFHGVIGDVLYLCKTLIANKKVKMDAHIDPNIPKVLQGDPSKLSQVLLNILGNSIKFIEEGDIHLKVKIKGRKDGVLYLEFSITDTGIGISEDQQKNIFDSFKQAEPDTFAKYGGSGLGLSIVKQIIEKQGGNITVKSKLGMGTTFKFLLPYGKGNDKKMVKAKESTLNRKEGLEQVKGICILVFEDNTLNQKLIETRLKSWECKTYITDNALYGLNILDNHKIDIVLMDLRMPGMNGFEVTERIRQSKNVHVRNIPVIALTADFTIQNKEQCEFHGINDYILKPYAAEELLSKIVKNKKNGGNSKTISAIQEEQKMTLEDNNLKMGLSCLLEECMGEFDVLENLVTLYKQNALEFIGSAYVSLKNNDWEQLAFAAHKIKSGLAMMQSNGLCSIAVQIQNCCRTGANKEQINSLYESFLEEYPKVEKGIDIELQKLRDTNE